MKAKTAKPKKEKFIDELSRVEPVFRSLLPIGDELLAWDVFKRFLLRRGFNMSKDTRFKPVHQQWEDEGKPSKMDLEVFARISQGAFLLIERIAQDDLIIPNFETFAQDIKDIFDKTKLNEKGEVATCIPQLARISPDKFAVSICTIDGQKISLGDADDYFCVQSMSKPVTYCLALEEHGVEKVHQHVGREPSGHAFNELSLNKHGLPHNPMVNAGAIMSSSLIKPSLSRADRFEYVINKWSKLMGNQSPQFSNPVYLSERETADRNFALGYFMRENKAFPEGTNLIDTLEFYFQCCSLQATSNMLSVLAATLANGGFCPFTYERVLQPSTVQHCLSLMYSCGMYDFSGEWAFSIGLPAKSGVGGGIIIVIPNVLGICTWSPKLDNLSNSVRGIEFCRGLLDKFNFHNFDNLLQEDAQHKADPRMQRVRGDSHRNADLLWACGTNKIRDIQNLIAKGVDLSSADYDGRTGLHLAASEGHIDVVKLLIKEGVPLMPLDRWGGSPLDDAKREKRKDIVTLLKSLLKRNKN